MNYRRFSRILLILPGLMFVSLHAAGAFPVPAARPQTGSNSRPARSAQDNDVEKAKIFMAEKKYEAAIQSFQDVLKSDPRNAMVLNMIGIAYMDLSRDDQAKKYFERSAKADKTYSSAVNNLGMIWYRRKNFRRAIREYQRAAEIDPTLAATHANLGFAYYNSNKLIEAATEFQKALELDPQIFENNSRVGTMAQDRSVANHGLFFFTMARVYAQKNDTVHCAEYLRKSLDEGYKEVGKAKTDAAFKMVLSDPGVQAVLVRAEEKAAAVRPGA